MTDPILEAAARALNDADGTRAWRAAPQSDREWYTNLARAVLATVTPLIEARTLERNALLVEATKALEGMQTAYYDFHDRHSMTEPVTGRAANANTLATDVLLRIRALKEQP